MSGAAPAPPRERQASARVATDPRISRRRQAVARTKRRRTIALSAFVAALVLSVWAAVWSPLLRVDRVEVVGERSAMARRVRDATGLTEADNLLLVSTSAVADRVEGLPWVADARVERRLPGTVRIRITERRPAIVLDLGTGAWTIDDRGRVLEGGRVSKRLPTLSGPTAIGSIRPGDELRVPEVTGALRAWRSLPRPVRARVVALFAPTRERLTFALDDETIVRYGAPEHLGAKNSVLVALLRSIRAEGRSVSYIDVRVPTNPALGPSTEPLPTPTP